MAKGRAVGCPSVRPATWIWQCGRPRPLLSGHHQRGPSRPTGASFSRFAPFSLERSAKRVTNILTDNPPPQCKGSLETRNPPQLQETNLGSPSHLKTRQSTILGEGVDSSRGSINLTDITNKRGESTIKQALGCCWFRTSGHLSVLKKRKLMPLGGKRSEPIHLFEPESGPPEPRGCGV